MIYLCVALMIIGAVFLVSEMFTPGIGVFGVLGMACVAASGYVALRYVPNGWMVVAAEAAVLAAVVYFVALYIKKKQLRGKIIMTEALNEDAPQSVKPDDFYGREGEAATSMRPIGEVDFNGFKLEAASDGAYIEKGSRVKVLDVRENKVIVRKIEGGDSKCQ